MIQMSAGNILWTPKEFEFSNMFSYGEDNKVRFDKVFKVSWVLFVPTLVVKILYVGMHYLLYLR